MKKSISYLIALAAAVAISAHAVDAPSPEVCLVYAKAAPGKTTEKVQSQATELGLTPRIAREDATNFVMTMDYLPLRLNLEVENGKVLKAYCG